VLIAPGVTDAAVIGLPAQGGEQVHAILILAPDTDPESVVPGLMRCSRTIRRSAATRSGANRSCRAPPDAQTEARPDPRPPARAGRGRARVIRRPGAIGRPRRRAAPEVDRRAHSQQRHAARRPGLSSLDRVELLVALEQRLGVPVDETVFASTRTIADLDALRTGQHKPPLAAAAFQYPKWNRHWLAHAFRAVNLNLWVLPLARVFAWVHVKGRENLRGLKGPVLFASNHQSYLDTPVIFIALGWQWGRRLAPAMRRNFFDAHFHPREHAPFHWFTNSLNYWLALLMFNALPIPQSGAGTRAALRALGRLVERGWCPLIYPRQT